MKAEWFITVIRILKEAEGVHSTLQCPGETGTEVNSFHLIHSALLMVSMGAHLDWMDSANQDCLNELEESCIGGLAGEISKYPAPLSS